MNKPTRKMGLAVLTGGLAFVGSASATELIVDGTFENTRPSSNPVVKVGGTGNPAVGGGWTLFSTYLYSTLYTLPGPANSGVQYLRPYPSGTYGITQSSQSVTQSVNLATATLTTDEIDVGLGYFTVSAWFSSYLTQGDFSTLTLEFLNETGDVLAPSFLLGGGAFVTGLPTGPNAKYTNAKQWGQDSLADYIPLDARTARITINATSVVGASDGYVDLVSLDVVDITDTTPVITGADPPNNAVHVGPVVDLSVSLKDRATAVDPGSIQLFLDDHLVATAIEKVDLTTTVRYSAGLLPALSTHAYKIIFADDGVPVRKQTNEFQFIVADYLTLPASLRGPLGSEIANQPGLLATVYQVETLTDPAAGQTNLTESIELSEAVLRGYLGTNAASRVGSEARNSLEIVFAVSNVVNWVNSSGATANFPNDEPFPGIPGVSGSENSFVHDVTTFVRFPAAGYYQMGVNNEDQFRLTVGEGAPATLVIQGPTNIIIPFVAIATNITQLQFGGGLPSSPLTAPVVYATPSGNPDDSCLLAGNPALAGKIVLLDRGGTACDSAAKAEQAQMAGAVAVLMTTPGDTGFPIRLNDINPNVEIPVLVIAENYGASALKSYLNASVPVTATIRGSTDTRIAEWDGPKGFGAVDVTVGFAVPQAGLYPMHLLAGQRTAGANLEWFSIEPDGTRILVNDTSNPKALLAFRSLELSQVPRFNSPTISGGQVRISWTGLGTLEEASAIDGPWQSSPNQNNPQFVPANGGRKFFRIHR